MKEKTVIGILCSGVGFMIGMLFMMYAYEEIESNRDCESVERDMLSFQSCLQYRPLCEGVTIDDFIEYYNQRDWAAEHCPVSASGDQLELSE